MNLKTAKDLASELGVTRESIYGAAKRDGRVQGYEIIKVGRKYAAINRLADIRQGRPTISERRKLPGRPVEHAGTCAVCGGVLSPRRTVRINKYDHCMSCNRRAFVDQCYETRKKLGI